MARTIKNKGRKTTSRKTTAGKTARKTVARKIPKRKRASTAQVKRSRRFKPGTVALREIRKYHQMTALIIPKTLFASVVREIALGIDGLSHYQFQAGALEALQEAAEAHLTKMFEAANLCANHAKRVTILQKDIELVRQLCTGWSLGPVSKELI